MSEEFERKRFPWARMGFDGEGLVVAVAVLLAGFLFAWATSWFDPLSTLFFWLGIIGAGAALAGSRWQGRTPPPLETGIVAPCDAVVVSITRVDAPSELRLTDSDVKRIRLSTGPLSTNKLYAPIAGAIDTLIVEAGERAVPFAVSADEFGLSQVFVTLESQDDQVGLRVATGGVGPRMEFDVEAGDMVRLGKRMGTRRLGGWCDIYIPAKVGVLVWPGQRLVGGETVLGRLVRDAGESDLFEELAENDDDLIIAPGTAVIADDAPYDRPEEASAPTDPAEMFARLREAARKEEDG